MHEPSISLIENQSPNLEQITITKIFMLRD
jgi:hypothetical protein